MFDEAGLPEVKIYASNELDEYIISGIKRNGAFIDAWGVGTKLVTAYDDPALTGVYKIVAKGTEGVFEPCIKISNNPEKITNPGIKNVYRFHDGEGLMLADLVYLEDEAEVIEKLIAERKPLRFNHPSIDYVHFSPADYGTTKTMLKPVIIEGERVNGPRMLQEIQEFTRTGMHSLHPTYKRMLNPHIYKVSISDGLKRLRKRLIDECCQEGDS